MTMDYGDPPTPPNIGPPPTHPADMLPPAQPAPTQPMPAGFADMLPPTDPQARPPQPAAPDMSRATVLEDGTVVIPPTVAADPPPPDTEGGITSVRVVWRDPTRHAVTFSVDGGWVEPEEEIGRWLDLGSIWVDISPRSDIAALHFLTD